jgi:two-component system, OmpR family, KDP operon response regulator KdpE
MADNKTRILIVDDEESIRRLLRLSFEAQNFQIHEAADGKTGEAAAAEFHPHLIVLDLGLPDISGLEVLKHLRKWTHVPILILTVQDDEATKVALLDAGADDYLTKPFGVPELMARVRVALRTHNRAEATPIFSSGDLVVNINQKKVQRKGEVVHLTATEFSLLSLLIRNNGKVVLQSLLLSEIWGPNSVEQSHYLRIYIAQLRKKIEDDPSNPKHVLTEPGIGYKIV